MDRLQQNEHDALRRLLTVANQDTSEGLRISHFLLAWGSEETHEGFRMNEAWMLPAPVRADMATVFSAAMRVGCLPDLLGYREAFQTLADDWLWHPTPIWPAR